MLRRITVLGIALLAAGLAAAEYTHNIMITGFWPPTNEMIRRFSNNPDQNPDGWIGENWEGRGYNIYSYFPEFPDGSWPIGQGDLEVDYQDTSSDFWRITDEVKPIALITFSRGNENTSWEIEWRQRNLKTWIDDYREPYQPTPSPPDKDEPAGHIRYSSLPMEEIRDAVNAAKLGIRAYIDKGSGFGGGFVSEFMAYHGTWYHDLHADPSDDAWCIAGGHIHVGGRVSIEKGIQATEISLRELIDYVDSQIPEPGSGVLALVLLLVSRRGLRTTRAA